MLCRTVLYCAAFMFLIPHSLAGALREQLTRTGNNTITQPTKDKKRQTFNGFYSIEAECEPILHSIPLSGIEKRSNANHRFFLPSLKIEFSIDLLLFQSHSLEFLYLEEKRVDFFNFLCTFNQNSIKSVTKAVFFDFFPHQSANGMAIHWKYRKYLDWTWAATYA